MTESWKSEFMALIGTAVARYQSGRSTVGNLFDPQECEFLKGIGATSQEIFDLVEDHVRDGEPGLEEILEVTALRKRYFEEVQSRIWSGTRIDMDALPAKTDRLGGIAWLPRIIEKAKAKLRGEMPPELMYGCGGDRPFLKRHNLSLGEFLQIVWDWDGQPAAILKVVEARQRSAQEVNS